jgi:hypothetical protein
MKIKYLVFVLFFLTAILNFAPSVNAQTTNCMSLSGKDAQISCLRELIAKLMYEVYQMQNAGQTTSTTTPVADTTTTSGTWCHTFNINLGYSNIWNAEVSYLHTALEKQGLSYAPDMGNIYVHGTATAVAKFQEKYASEILTPFKLTAGTGYMGYATRAKLNAL